MKKICVFLWVGILCFPSFLFPSPSSFLENLVFSSIDDDDQPELYQLLKVDKLDPNKIFTDEGETPLLYAVFSGKSWAVQMLLSAGANPNFSNKAGYSALHLAAQEGFSDIAKTLLDSGSNPCALNQDRFMPIHLAASFGKIDVVNVLSKSCQGNVDIGGIDDVTPLDLAAQNGFNDIVVFLLALKADPNASAKNSRGHPLHFAVHGGHPDTVKILLDHGARVNDTNDTGDTPFTWNGYIGNVQTAKILLEAGAKPEITTKRFGYNALHTATIRGKSKLIRYFLENKIYTGQEKSGIKALPIHYASLYGFLESAKILLDAGNEISAQDTYGNTPLHYAISNNQRNMACFLLSRGANTQIKNRHAQTPINLAKSMGMDDWIPFLENKSC